MEKCDKCGEFIEFARLCPLCAHYEKERLKRSAKKCEERARKAEELARELVAALQGVSGMLDYATGECRCGVCEYCNVQKRADKALAKAEEVLGEVICNIHDNPELLGVD